MMFYYCRILGVLLPPDVIGGVGEGGKDMVSKRLKVASGGGVKRSELNMRVHIYIL